MAEELASLSITSAGCYPRAIRSMPEHTFALIFALRRSLVQYHQAVHGGRWQEAGTFCFFDFPINDLYGSNLGIIGDGVLGKAVANIGHAFGMKVSFAAHDGPLDAALSYESLDAILTESDIISIHCPLLPSTRDLISVTAFAKNAASTFANQYCARWHCQ